MKMLTIKVPLLAGMAFVIGWGSASRDCHADVDDGTVLHHGEATFYGEGGLGHCGFTSVQPAYHGAMNHTDYDSSAACGTWVHIFGPKGDVVAFIDDECPECKEGDIDLGPNTFDMVADRTLGRVPITWRYVPSPLPY
jgi:expansin (peptidoglycan-binding protein)